MIFVEIGVSLVGNHTYVPYTSGDVRISIRQWIHLPDLSDVNILCDKRKLTWQLYPHFFENTVEVHSLKVLSMRSVEK